LDVFNAIQARKSIRAYQDTPIPREVLERILEAGRLAPSARNVEPWHFIVVTSTKKRKALAKGVYAKFLSEAPLVVAVLGDRKASEDWYAVDASLALENMVLEAVNEGLGTCIVGSFNEAEVKELLKIPDSWEVIALLATGYPRDKLDFTSKLLKLVRARKLISEVVSEEEYGSKFVPQKYIEP
jgi:nitroreductase